MLEWLKFYIKYYRRLMRLKNKIFTHKRLKLKKLYLKSKISCILNKNYYVFVIRNRNQNTL